MPEVDFAPYHDALIFLAAAGVVIPVFHRLRISPVLGFILVGLAIGPYGLGRLDREFPALGAVTIADAHDIEPAAELGVGMLMFMIGLELSFERIWVMRRLVFGLGALQVAICAAVLAGALRWTGVPWAESVVIGLALAMSSTAIVLQVLANAGGLNGPAGRASFAVLLFQDLAAMPVLFAVGLLGRGGESGAREIALAAGQAVVAVLLLIGLGRLALRPLFRTVARTGSPELFMAACLLVVIATGLATAAAGLSMALGALIAGMLLAGTEYRRQIEITIDPFKGLLLGVFLVSVGMGLDTSRVMQEPLTVLGEALALVLLKFVPIVVLARLHGLHWRPAVQAGLLLGPGGEFGFVILGFAAPLGLVSGDAAASTLLVVALTMAAIPLLHRLGGMLLVRAPTAAMEPLPDDVEPRVIIAGFGRVGETVAAMLAEHRLRYVAIDSDPDRVAAQRKRGVPVYWGDITRVEMLRLLHLEMALALVVTMDDARAAEALVTAARAERGDLLIVARARDARHAAQLYAAGASDAVPETVEASLQLAEAALVDLGVPMGHVIASIHDKRASFQTEIKARAPGARIRPLGRRRLRDARPG